MISTHKDLLEYSIFISQEEPNLLQKLNRETHQKAMHPRMISGALQGRLLSLIAKLLHPSSILEIGTFTGYSTLCMAEGLASGGILHTIDRNEELVYLQNKYFEASPYRKQIHQHLGDALKIIPTLKNKFDLIFIDADKKNYLNYYELIFPKLKKGGVLISDNVLWYGKVVQPTKKGDIDTKILKAYNQRLKEDARMESILLPIRDGILISRKKK